MTNEDRDLWIGVALGAVAVVILFKLGKRGSSCGGCSRGPATVLPFAPRGDVAVTVRDKCDLTRDTALTPAETGGYGLYAQGAGPISPVEFHG